MELNLSQSAAQQSQQYNQKASQRAFQVGTPVWLTVPTAGKLQPRWEGNWIVKSVISPSNLEITDGKRERVVHVNRVRRRIQPGLQDECPSSGNQGNKLTSILEEWEEPQIDHYPAVQEPVEILSPTRYPSQNRRPPQFYRPSIA